MGAHQFQFCHRHKGTPEEAFDSAVAEAEYDYGHAGYTGTIAEKNNFGLAVKENTLRTIDEAEALLDDTTDLWDQFDDKWGPAGCIPVGENGKVTGYIFFGWASS